MSNSNRRTQLRAAQQKAAERDARQRRVVWAGAGVVGTVLLVILGIVIWQAVTTGGGTATPPHQTSNGDAFAVAADKAVAGAPEVSVYYDYQCPGCKALDDTFGQELLTQARNGAIKLTFHPLTFLDRMGSNKSTNPTIAAACADSFGVFPEYHLAIYRHQPATEGTGYTDEQLRVTIPQEVGLAGDDLKKFQQCYDTRATATWVSNANKLNATYTAEQAKTDDQWSYTPAVAVNGKLMDKTKLTEDPTSITALIKQMAA